MLPYTVYIYIYRPTRPATYGKLATWIWLSIQSPIVPSRMQLWRVWRHTIFNLIPLYVTRRPNNVNPLFPRSVRSFMDNPQYETKVYSVLMQCLIFAREIHGREAGQTRLLTLNESRATRCDAVRQCKHLLMLLRTRCNLQSVGLHMVSSHRCNPSPFAKTPTSA